MADDEDATLARRARVGDSSAAGPPPDAPVLCGYHDQYMATESDAELTRAARAHSAAGCGAAHLSGTHEQALHAEDAEGHARGARLARPQHANAERMPALQGYHAHYMASESDAEIVRTARAEAQIGWCSAERENVRRGRPLDKDML